jgi:hypothetical protein
MDVLRTLASFGISRSEEWIWMDEILMSEKWMKLVSLSLLKSWVGQAYRYLLKDGLWTTTLSP